MKSIWLALFVGCCLVLEASCGLGASSEPTKQDEDVERTAAASLAPSCSAGPRNALAAGAVAQFVQTIEDTCAGSSDVTVVPSSSDQAETALTTASASGPSQAFAPMSRPLSAAAVCATQVGSPSTAASLAVGLRAAVVSTTSQFDVCTTADGQTLPTSPPYTIRDWRDALRLLYAGVGHDPNDVKDCTRPERQYLADHWQSLFGSTCSGGNCAGIQHLFRGSDFADSTEVLLAQLGLPPVSQNPFCNGWGSSFSKAGDADYVDGDPIRRPCSHTARAPLGVEQPGDQVCSPDGTLGLVLPIVLPEPSVATPWADDPNNVYPPQLCTRYWFLPAGSDTTCPDGTAPDRSVPQSPVCVVPVTTDPDGTDDFNCITPEKLGNPISPPTGKPERLYNLTLRAKDGTVRLDRWGRPIVGAFYRLRSFASRGGCVFPSTNDQLACLSAQVPCSLGVSAYSAAADPKPPPSMTSMFSPSVSYVNLGGVAPGTATIQSGAYPLAQPVYINSVVGFDHFTGAEQRLRDCWTRSSLASSASLHAGLVALPNGPSCVDFDERQCGATSNTDACASASAPPSCDINVGKELMITDLSVVEDPVRTAFAAQDNGDPRQGAFTIKHLFESISVTPQAAPEQYQRFITDFLVNSVTFDGQATTQVPDAAALVVRDSAGNVDLTRVPWRLLAITSRIDLRDLTKNMAGEARFVFGATNPDGSIFFGGYGIDTLTLIFEFALPAQTEADVQAWAQSWHALGALQGEAYNAALQVLTDRFTARGAMPARPNGSALNFLRMRDTVDELREFLLCSAGSSCPSGNAITYQPGWLYEEPPALTPNVSTNRVALSKWVNAHAGQVLSSTETFDAYCPNAALDTSGTCVMGDSYADPPTFWDMPNTVPSLRSLFGINTCIGCHQSETGSNVFQIAMRPAGTPSALAPFLTGVGAVFAGDAAYFENNPDATVDLTRRHFNELERRAADLRNIVCPLSCSAP
jgi:hypothetical protein